MSISDEKYVACTTYRSNGEPRSVPVWIADLGDGRVGFTTAESSHKIKRIRNDPRVMLQPCDVRGNPRGGSEPIGGTAEVLSGADFEAVQARVKAKYGYQYTAVGILAKFQRMIGRDPGASVGVAVTLD